MTRAFANHPGNQSLPLRWFGCAPAVYAAARTRYTPVLDYA